MRFPRVCLTAACCRVVSFRVDAVRVRRYFTEAIHVIDDIKPHELRYLTDNRKGPRSPLTRLGSAGAYAP